MSIKDYRVKAKLKTIEAQSEHIHFLQKMISLAQKELENAQNELALIHSKYAEHTSTKTSYLISECLKRKQNNVSKLQYDHPELTHAHPCVIGTDMGAGVKKPIQDSLHLYSLVNFWTILHFVLNIFMPSRVCEIGVQSDLLFNKIRQEFPNTKYVGVDPSLSLQCKDEIERAGGEVICEPSVPDGITKAGPCDVYFIDGDHNYLTVKSELDKIFSFERSCEDSPLIVLHDVCWPTDRRDSYHYPSYMKDVDIHENSAVLGVHPKTTNLIASHGMMATQTYRFRNEYGGKENGVLTAVEDFIEQTDFCDTFTIVPGIFGVGFLYSSKTLNKQQKDCMRFFENAAVLFNDYISTLEYNRIDLLSVIDHHSE